METYSFEQYQESAEALRARLGGFTPKPAANIIACIIAK